MKSRYFVAKDNLSNCCIVIGLILFLIVNSFIKEIKRKCKALYLVLLKTKKRKRVLSRV